MTRFVFILLCALSCIGIGSVGKATAQGSGEITCQVSDNGKAAAGTLRMEQDGRAVASGNCGAKALRLPPGSYTAVLSLDGALDGPEQRSNVKVVVGKNPPIAADFRTGTLRISIEQSGRRAAGMATLERKGKRIGTLGGGVTAHLSAGAYTVIVRYRDQELRFDGVVIAAGAHRELQASF